MNRKKEDREATAQLVTGHFGLLHLNKNVGRRLIALSNVGPNSFILASVARGLLELLHRSINEVVTSVPLLVESLLLSLVSNVESCFQTKVLGGIRSVRSFVLGNAQEGGGEENGRKVLNIILGKGDVMLRKKVMSAFMTPQLEAEESLNIVA